VQNSIRWLRYSEIQSTKPLVSAPGLPERLLHGRGLSAAVLGESSHWSAKFWCRSLCQLFKFLLDLVKRLRSRYHSALRINKITNSAPTPGLELIKEHVLSAMHHLLTPEKALLVNMRHDYACADSSRAPAEFCAPPHGFPGQPGLLDKVKRRHIHLWAWLTRLVAAPYPPHDVAGDAGDCVEVSVEYDVRTWLKELASSVGIDSNNELLFYVMQDIWQPQLVPLCAIACIPTVTLTAAVRYHA
jgi:hypothetical protein